ncbi:hypothetical protein CY34DRAFT_797674 [Suillus luteus UH-Slu-Lm8-n1]|uniref:Uncharacterized protein n=1 Tax=Suillus luteus UH-Slu-Lm8-n1 TaxID=930992 RepID=A0A0D0B480_9AGAM|nr:hypothetical protein CY34DRAFT_797674 [Suillus luteus UH-Slu-Lm8-n1]
MEFSGRIPAASKRATVPSSTIRSAQWYRNSTICIVHQAQSETLDLVFKWREAGRCKPKFFNKHYSRCP